MKFSHIRMASMALGLVLGAGSIVSAGAKDEAALAKAPAAVQAAARKALGDKKLDEFGKESVGGKIIYEIGYKLDGTDHAYVFSESGELIQEEADVEVSKLPEAVVKAVKKAQPEGKIDEAALATAGDKHFYVVDVKVGKDTHAIKVATDGTVMADDIEKEMSDGEKSEGKEDKKD